MESIWHQTAGMPRFAPQEGHIQTQVLIIGGGMTGLLCGYLLRQAGIDCVIAERGRICGGTTGGTTAKMTVQHGLIYHRLLRYKGERAAKQYYQANLDALTQLRTLCSSMDCDFQPTDAYIYGRHEAVLQEEWSALQRLGIPAEYTAETELPFPISGAIRFSDQAQFHPLKFARALAETLPIMEDTWVKSFDGKCFQTNRGTITAEQIIVATHFPIFNKHGGFFLKMYQQRSYVLALEPEQTSVPSGMYLDGEENGLSFRSHGHYLLLGGGGHRTGEPGGGWTTLVQAARKYYPQAKIWGRWAAQDCITLDGMPYIGRYSPRIPNLFVATGFNKWGMTSSMLSAMILCDRIQGKDHPYAKLFSPSRRMPLVPLMKNGFHAAKNLLMPGPPRCPHMGCALRWNQQEHSWDCSCHGSRFSEAGTLLDGPANDDTAQPPQAL